MPKAVNERTMAWKQAMKEWTPDEQMQAVKEGVLEWIQVVMAMQASMEGKMEWIQAAVEMQAAMEWIKAVKKIIVIYCLLKYWLYSGKIISFLNLVLLLYELKSPWHDSQKHNTVVKLVCI